MSTQLATIVSQLERSREPRLQIRLDLPEGEIRGRVLLIHGYAEHSARYDRVVAVWRERGLAVARFDLRGHGGSAGEPRGHIQSFSEYVEDVRAVLANLDREPKWSSAGQVALFGHSLGGLIAARTVLELPGRFRTLVLSSPFFGVKHPPPAIARRLAPLVARLLPTLKQPSNLSGKDLTHDAELVAGYDNDPLGFPHVTVGWFVQVQKTQAEVIERAPRLSVPLFCIAAGDDRVVDLAATRRFFERAGSAEKELDVRPLLFHEILNEPEWRELAVTFAERLLPGA